MRNSDGLEDIVVQERSAPKRWLARKRREYHEDLVFNVNVNALGVGLVATAAAVGTTALLEYVGASSGWVVGGGFALNQVVQIFLGNYVHRRSNRTWLQDHNGEQDVKAERKSTLRYQALTYAAGPTHFFTAAGGQYALMRLGLGDTLAASVSYIAALGVSWYARKLIGHRTGLFNGMRNTA